MERGDFVLYNLDVHTWEEAIREMSKPLYEAGIVTKGYADEVIEREKEYPTALPTMKIGVAIPHTESVNISKNQCVAAFLQRPIKWHSMEDMDLEIDVQVVLLLAAIDSADHLEFLQKLSTVLSNEDILTQLSNVHSKESFIHVLDFLIKEGKENMAYFEKDLQLPTWFGDFGGLICTDGDALLNAGIYDKVIAAMTDEGFDVLFTRNLKSIMPEMPEIKEYKVGRKTIYVAPKMSRYYNLAGQITVGKLAGYDTVKAGCFNKNLGMKFAKLAKENGLKAELVLSRAIAKDEELLKYLKEQNCAYNNQICVVQVDDPYGMYQPPFFRPDFYHVMLEGNVGGGYKPALVGKLAGIYGRNLGKRIFNKVDAVVVPITTGTEALGVIGGMKSQNYDLTYVTVEEAISEELHIGDTNTYTISTRNADRDEMYTTLCPELINYWREAEVKRYGADKLGVVDTDCVRDLGLNDVDARALTIALERLREERILFIGGEKQ